MFDQMLKFSLRSSAILAALVLAILPAACGKPQTEGDWTVSESVVIDASPDAVWEVVGNYYDVHSWHPGIFSTQKSGARDAEIRFLILNDGNRIYEELLADSDSERMYRYKILEAPLPVVDYTGQLFVTPQGSGSRVTWAANFRVDGDEKQVQDAVRGVFSGGLNALAEKFAAR